MKIQINQSGKEPWGRLSIDDAQAASQVLSGETFKVWVALALNQDGYTYKGTIDRTAVQELVEHSYLISAGGGDYLFHPDGGAMNIVIPPQWGQIVKLYGADGTSDYGYVINKLSSITLDGKIRDIIDYWISHYKQLRTGNISNVKNSLRYDFSIVLTWWIKENFHFEIGDVIVAGPKASRLRFHNDLTKKEIQRALVEHNTETFTIHKNNLPYWNSKVRSGQIEIRHDDIGTILRERNLGA